MSGRKKAMTQPIVSQPQYPALPSPAVPCSPPLVQLLMLIHCRMPLCVQNQIFRLLQRRERVVLWLYENTTIRLEGVIIGFDEYMNVVLDDATEVDRKKKTRTELGRILLKGDNITLIQHATPQTASTAAAAGGVR